MSDQTFSSPPTTLDGWRIAATYQREEAQKLWVACEGQRKRADKMALAKDAAELTVRNMAGEIERLKRRVAELESFNGRAAA